MLRIYLKSYFPFEGCMSRSNLQTGNIAIHLEFIAIQSADRKAKGQKKWSYSLWLKSIWNVILLFTAFFMLNHLFYQPEYYDETQSKFVTTTKSFWSKKRMYSVKLITGLNFEVGIWCVAVGFVVVDANMHVLIRAIRS